MIKDEPVVNVDLKDGIAEMIRPRRLIKKLGQTFLGDGWKGQIKVEENVLYSSGKIMVGLPMILAEERSFLAPMTVSM